MLTPIKQPTTPVPKAFVPAPTRAPPPAFPGTLPSRTSSASTGKAKKVMDWFRKKSLVQEIENENQAGPPAPQVFVTDPASITHTAAPSGSAPPSAWSGPRAASTTAIAQNGPGFLQPPAWPSLSFCINPRGLGNSHSDVNKFRISCRGHASARRRCRPRCCHFGCSPRPSLCTRVRCSSRHGSRYIYRDFIQGPVLAA